MAITGTFLADFTSFSSAVQKAEVSLKDLETGSGKVEKALSRMGDSFSGKRIIQDANLMVKAIGDLENVSKLTEAEQRRVNATVTEAIQKYTTLGKVAPQAMHDLAEATAKVPQPIDKSSDALARFSERIKGADITSPLQADVVGLGEDLAGLAGPIGLAIAGIAAMSAALFKLTSEAAKVGAELDDMSDKTGVSVQALSRLKNAAEVGGTDMNRLTDALFKLQKGLEEDSEKVSKGLERIGLTTEQVKAAGPDKMLELVAEAFAKTEDGGKRAAATTEIFKDRTGEMIPALLNLNAGMRATADIMPWTPEQAAAAERFEQHVRSISVHVKAQVEALGRDLIPAVDRTVNVLVTAVAQFYKTGYEMSGLKAHIDLTTIAWNLYAEAIERANGVKTPAPTPPPAPPAPGVQLPGTAGVMASDLAKGLELAESATRALNAEAALSIDVNTRAAAAAKQSAADFKKWAEIMDKDAAAAIVKLLQGLAELEARMKILNAVVPLDVQFGIDATDSDAIWELAKSFTGLGEEIGITSSQISDFKSHMDSLPKQTRSDFDAEQLALAQKHAEMLDRTYMKLAETLILVGSSTDTAFGSTVQFIGQVIQAITAEIKVLRDLETAAFSANAALGLFGIGFMVGNWITKKIRGGATGGMVTPSGIQPFSAPSGPDSVLTRLAPNEMVLNPSQQRNIAAKMGGGGISISFDQRGAIFGPNAGREIAKIATDAIIDRIAQNKSGRGAAGAGTRLRAGLGMKS